MANITMIRQSDGMTMTIDENSPLRGSLKAQGFIEQTSTPPQDNTSSGWVDPATGKPTAVGVGEPKSEYDKRNGGAGSNTGNNNPITAGNNYSYLDPNGYSLVLYNGEQIMAPNSGASGWDSHGVTVITPNLNKDGTPITTNNTKVDELYQKYFGRNATSAEKTEWSKKTPESLDTYLKAQYKAASGVDYNGSPILPGTNKPAVEISPEDKAWVNAAYQKYFDRPATSAELANWAKETPAALEQFLAKEQKTYGYVSTAMGKERKDRYDAAIRIIRESNLPDDIKKMWETTVSMYPDATDFNTEEIMKTFNDIKTSTIDPYYKELADVAIKDIQTSIGEMGWARQRELEVEQANAQKAVTEAQSGLEKTGMTFSGKGVEQLGTGGAYAQGTTGTIPSVATPFAGIDPNKMQGSVGQANRLISTSTAARYASDQQALGRKAENLLGTAGMSGITGLNYNPAGVNLTGELATAKEEKSASALQSLINQWRAKQENALNK